MEKLQLHDLEEREDWKEAIIVFKPESFEKEYTEEQRSYKVGRYCKWFQKGAIGCALYGDCLDGTDKGIRLDWYIKSLPKDNLGKRWIVDYCYIIK